MEDFITFKSFDLDKTESPSGDKAAFDRERPMLPQDLPSSVIKTLTDRLGDEYTAYYLYRNAANWCKGVNYPKAAAFFEKEAAGELEHATGIQDYLVQWNIHPTIPQVETSREFSSLIDVINCAYRIEWELLQKYSTDLQEMLRDHAGTFNFLQKYVDIQVAEVAEYSDYLNALQLIDYKDRLSLLMFEDKYFG